MLVNKERLVKNIKREYYSRSFYSFFIDAWNEVEGVPYIDNWHIKSICDVLQERYMKQSNKENDKDILINCPPGSSKSLIVSVMYPC